ncbi:hypothetical protein AB1K83_10605 [Sporosarcina sp. 179-K 3D1 HS]|uniref:hypothetical protein n=1 Tax=Sporosarcina sp. 179-K 3D1 HS TaxID=3232169 RepID=UPI0039A34B60
MRKGRAERLGYLLAAVLLLTACTATETQVEQDVEEEPIVTIEGQSFDEEDLKFYTTMKQVEIEWGHLQAIKGLQGEELAERNAYWDEHKRQYANKNVQLQNLIEIHAMSLLAEEKNYFVPDEKLDREVEELTKAIQANEETWEIVQEYGEEDYRLDIREYLRKRLLRDRVYRELEKQVREELPDATDQEVNYATNSRYEDLYVEQVASLERKIYVK